MLKKIEYIIKGLFDKLLTQKMPPQLIELPEQKFKFADGSRILLLRHDRIGDILVSVPFIRALRKIFPKIEIDILLCTKNITAKRAVDSYVNNIFNYDKKLTHTIKLITKLRSRHYDMLIDLFDNPSTTSSYLIKLISPLYALGLDKSNSNIYTHIVPLPDKNSVHIVERIANLLLPFGISPSKSDLHLDFRLSPAETKRAKELMNKSDNKTILGINLSGSSRAKFWGVENYISFINLFKQNYPNIDVVIFSTKDYSEDLNRIIASADARPSPEANSFIRFASFLSVCDYILTPDTSAVHLAAAFKVPCVSLHTWTGTSDTGMPWHSYNSPHKCLKTDTGNLKNISPESVLAAISELITENGSK